MKQRVMDIQFILQSKQVDSIDDFSISIKEYRIEPAKVKQLISIQVIMQQTISKVCINKDQLLLLLFRESLIKNSQLKSRQHYKQLNDKVQAMFTQASIIDQFVLDLITQMLIVNEEQKKYQQINQKDCVNSNKYVYQEGGILQISIIKVKI
ncbi:hypothetical protein TTHERM_00564040 (macronuclear) [Tetrahymena thermophila SB210]|uniref:Uncharacterized protein n=1 Tax=Tetrahymena thermophila (strain SB210) TaxID=312017 RepID=I7M9H4_TETTS|nr:hypothetical protein TTHERM_00564040 [Tetrahymena thermophila SB210]EAS01758.2 hypothetical protein TTHERM_00564040 [Tetrahymena thermophila SB210]|eukprot:XP_001022003.2 hypothetical protein TTHERM_00564040 [Tetrahymena thermophila SB210]